MINIPKLTVRIKEIMKTYKESATPNTIPTTDSVFNALSPFIKFVVLNSDVADSAYWNSAGIRTESPIAMNACMKKLASETKLLGEGANGKVYSVPNKPCIKHVPASVKQVAVKMETVSQEYFKPNQTPARLRDVITIAERAGKLKIGPQMYDAFVVIDKKQVQIVKVFEIIEGETWKNMKWNSPADKITAVKKLDALIHKMNKAGIIHHDLHSGNVIVKKTGDIRIIDFDLAKLANNEEADAVEYFKYEDRFFSFELMDRKVRYVYDKLVEDGDIIIGGNTRKTRKAKK